MKNPGHAGGLLLNLLEDWQRASFGVYTCRLIHCCTHIVTGIFQMHHKVSGAHVDLHIICLGLLTMPPLMFSRKSVLESYG